jgi:hypothetical protein
MRPIFTKVNDWSPIIKDFQNKKEINSKLTAETFCKQNNLNYQTFTRNNAKMKAINMPLSRVNAIKTVIKEEVKKNLVEQAKERLQSLSLPAAEKVGLLLEAQGKDGPDSNVQAKAAFGILDRVGLSPQTDKLQVNLATQINVALFPQDHKEDLEEMLK